jgi:DNA polymerase-3 subunit beta
VAAKGLIEVQRLAGDGQLEVVFGDRDVVFRTAKDVEVTARLIDGQFPNYEQLIPSGYPNRLVVNRQALLEALDRVQIVGQNNDGASVRLTMSAEVLELSMTADAGSAQEVLEPAKFTGTELTAAFNPVFLREGIDAVSSENVALDTIDPLKPATLRGDDDDFLYLLMPVRTS